MKTAAWRIAVLSVIALALGGYLAGCGGDEGSTKTLLVVWGYNDNPSSGQNVHLWVQEGPAQVASAQVAAQGVEDTPHIVPGHARALLRKQYYADPNADRRDLPEYIDVYAGRGNNPNLGSKRIILPAQIYRPGTGRMELVPLNVDVKVYYSDGPAGPVWDVDVDYLY